MVNKKFVITEENAKEYCDVIGTWIKENIENAHANGVVLGMTSGIDCSVVAGLCKNAGVNINLVLLPYGKDMNKSKSYSDAMELINKFGFDYHMFDIKPAVDNIQISDDFIKDCNENNVKLAKANIRPRMRMTYLYQYAQINNLLVIGTSNLSEYVTGYFTKFGDNAYDINPIGNFT